MVRAKVRYLVTAVDPTVTTDATSLYKEIRSTMTQCFGLVSHRIDFQGTYGIRTTDLRTDRFFLDQHSCSFFAFFPNHKVCSDCCDALLLWCVLLCLFTSIYIFVPQSDFASTGLRYCASVSARIVQRSGRFSPSYCWANRSFQCTGASEPPDSAPSGPYVIACFGRRSSSIPILHLERRR
jgi:hypothetical protein